MAFTKSDGTAGAFNPDGTPKDNKNDGGVTQGIDSDLGTDSANQDATDTTASDAIKKVNVPDANDIQDTRTQSVTSSMENAAIRAGNPKFKSNTGKLGTGANAPVPLVRGVADKGGLDISDSVALSDADKALAPSPGAANARADEASLLFPDLPWWTILGPILGPIVGGGGVPGPGGTPTPDLEIDCNDVKSDPDNYGREGCFHSRLCNTEATGCFGLTSPVHYYRNIFQGQLGPYSGYWADFGDGGAFYSSSCCADQTGSPLTGTDTYRPRGNANFTAVQEAYGYASFDDRACGEAMDCAVGDCVPPYPLSKKVKGWRHVLQFIGTGSGDPGTDVECMPTGQGMWNDTGNCWEPGTPLDEYPTRFRGFFFEPTCESTGYGNVDLIGCWGGTLSTLNRVGTFVPDTPSDPCFCKNKREGGIDDYMNASADAGEDQSDLPIRLWQTGCCRAEATGDYWAIHPSLTPYGRGGETAAWNSGCCGFDIELLAVEPANSWTIGCFNDTWTARAPASWGLPPDECILCTGTVSGTVVCDSYLYPAVCTGTGGGGGLDFAWYNPACCASGGSVTGECEDVWYSGREYYADDPDGGDPYQWVDYTGWDGDPISAADDRNWWVIRAHFSGSRTGDVSGVDCQWLYDLVHYECIDENSLRLPTNRTYGTAFGVTDIPQDEIGVTMPFKYCGPCLSVAPIYATGELVTFTGAVAPSTGRNYKIESGIFSGDRYGTGAVGEDCQYIYTATYYCNGIRLSPTVTGPSGAFTTEGATFDCNDGGNCVGNCIYRWDGLFENWVHYSDNCTTCDCYEPTLQDGTPGEFRNGTCM